MAQTYNAIYKRFNGVDWDTVNFIHNHDSEDRTVEYGKSVFFKDSSGGLGAAMKMSGEDWILYEPEDGNKEWLKFDDDVGLYVLGTKVSLEGHTHDYLGISAKAADSDKLDGNHASAFALTGHKYHVFSGGEFYFDSYAQGNFLRMFIENSAFDTVRYGAIANVEYHNGSSWVAWSGGDASIRNILDGREDTSTSIDHTHRRFRFEVTRNGPWPTTALLILQENWTGLSHPECNITVETWNGSSWDVKDTTLFGASTTGNTLGIHMKVTAGLHDGKNPTRVTIEYDDWTDNGSYTTIPIKRFMILSNFNGISQLPWTWDYYKKVTFPANIQVNGNTYLGNGNGDTTIVNDILQIGSSDSGDSHLYFGEDSANWYGAHLYWDSAYTFIWNSRYGGTDTELFRYDTRTPIINFAVTPQVDSNDIYHEGNKPSVTDVFGRPAVSSGNYWDAVPYIGNDGVMEVGKYIDFHESDNDSDDYDGRLQVSTGILQFNGYSIYHTNNKPSLTDLGNIGDLSGKTAAEITTEISNAIAALVDSSPGTLDTLNELAAALGDDPNFATTMTNALANKLNKNSIDTLDYGVKIAQSADAQRSYFIEFMNDAANNTLLMAGNGDAGNQNNLYKLINTTYYKVLDTQNFLEGTHYMAAWDKDYSDLINKPSTFPPSTHSHDISDLPSNLLVDGDVDEAATASKIPIRDSLGNLKAKNFITSSDLSASAAAYMMIDTGDGYLRRKTLANVKNELVTKAQIEAQLTGEITSHSHPAGAATGTWTNIRERAVGGSYTQVASGATGGYVEVTEGSIEQDAILMIEVTVNSSGYTNNIAQYIIVNLGDYADSSPDNYIRSSSGVVVMDSTYIWIVGFLMSGYNATNPDRLYFDNCYYTKIYSSVSTKADATLYVGNVWKLNK